MAEAPAFRYSTRALAADYARSLFGASVTLPIALLAQPVAWIGWTLGAIGALFLVYFARTVCRQLTRFEVDGAGIRAQGPCMAGGPRMELRWDRLCSLRLDYYSTRMDREGGWMQLRLGDGQHTLRIDSGLDGFVELARIASDVAARRGLALDIATLANLQALEH